MPVSSAGASVWHSTWVGLGNAFIGSLLPWAILGRRTRVMTQHLNSRTMPDFFGLRFLSPGLKTVAALIVFVFLIPYTASLFNGLSRLFTMAFPQIDYAWCAIVMAVLTGVYVIIGGYMATAINDFIQGVIMIVGIVAVIAAVLHGRGGFSDPLRGSRRPGCTGRGTQHLGAFTSFFGLTRCFCCSWSFCPRWARGVCRRWSASLRHQNEDSIRKGYRDLDGFSRSSSPAAAISSAASGVCCRICELSGRRRDARL